MTKTPKDMGAARPSRRWSLHESHLIRFALTALTILILILPFVVLISHAAKLTDLFRFSLGHEVSRSILFTSVQAALSAGASLALGLLGAFGLQAVLLSRGPVVARWCEALVLLPNAVPVLLVIIAALKLFPWARGLPGIVLVHTVLNAGLIAVAAVRLFRAKISGLAELAWIEGSSRWRFFRRGVLPLLWMDFQLLFLFVFAVCFSSFAVPLVLGGSRATTTEVLIFQKIRIEGDWLGALALSSVQMLVLFVMTMVLRRENPTAMVGRATRAPLLSWGPGLIAILLPTLLLIVGMTEGLGAGLRQIRNMEFLGRELPSLIARSFVVGVGSGLACATALLMLAFLAPQGWLRRFLIGYVAPSSVLTGFALLILWRDPSQAAAMVRMIVGITIVAVPSFYRLQWDATLQGLEGQRQVARTLGASDGLIFARVIFPQVIRAALAIGGLAAFWAWGDFALSSVVASRAITLAMLAHSLMESYRLDAATVLVWLVVLGGAVTFFVFVGVGNVVGSKSDV
jgi:thiamine transport system permease protein